MKRVFAAAAVLALPLTAIATAPAQAAPSPNNHLLDIVKVTSGSVTVKTSCNPDPNPDTGTENLFVNFPDLGLFGGITQITCNGQKQTVVVPLTDAPAVGTRAYTVVTVSGDSGEINDFGTFRVGR